MSKKLKKIRLPNQILPLGNPDKTFHEKWYDGRNILNIVHPWRGCLLGPPNCGKGTIVKNIILRAKPAYEEIICVHCDPDYTAEWCDVEATMLSEIPAPDEWEGEVKTLVILDDIDCSALSKSQKSNLDRLYGFCSTHKNLSVCICLQDPFSVPVSVRRCTNLWVMWRCPDLDAMATVSRKTGMKSQNFNAIFNQLMCDTHDSLWLDQTHKSPYPMRKNGFEIISKDDGEDTKRELSKLDKFKTINTF